MKCPFFQVLITAAALCLFFPAGSIAQNERPSVASSIKKVSPRHSKKITPQPVKTTPPMVASKNQPSIMRLCDNDVEPPVIQCLSGNCLPNARAVYLTTANYDQPWGRYDNFQAMETVFGAGNWDTQYLENADVVTLFTPNNKVIFMDGSQYAGPAMYNFLVNYQAGLENWVAAGGALFINSCPVNTQTFIDFGFDGVAFQCQVSGYQGIVQEPGHPVFNGPFTPANGNFSGSYFAEFQYGSFSGNVGLPLIIGNGVALSEKTWGNGKVYFGAILPPSLDAPQPNIVNLWRNILADLNALCNSGVIVPADAGACVATVPDQSLDATATDDCALASLTHDFAAAPSNTTLAGAVLPPGNTTVRWTATDVTGNSSTCETLFFVRESEVPVITCPQDIAVNADAGSCGAVATFDVTAADNCTASPNLKFTTASGTLFGIGTTVVTATVNDESYNTNSCSFSVTVTPNPEVCNGLDDDCNGIVDDGATGENTFYRDNDGDGYGDPNNALLGTCPIPYGYVFNALDCDDVNYYVNPGMPEYCNGVDDNCDGQIDEGVAPLWYADTDGDGYGDPNITQYACNQPQGFVYGGGDCDDSNAYIHPGAMEDCTNLTDENCDGILGENNFTIEETHTDVFCGSNPDGSIHLNMVPAQNYPVILWSNGSCCTTDLTNLNFGIYTVTVTNECGTSKTRTVAIQPSAEPALQVSFTGTDFICGNAGDGSITATASDGCGGYTYLWNTGSTDAAITGLSGGSYQVLVTDACGCTRAGEFIVNEPVQVSFYFGNVIPLLDGTYFVQVVPYGGTGPYKFRRSTPPSGFTDWSSSNGFLGVAPGDYVFEVEDAHGCQVQLPLSLSPLAPRPMDLQHEATTPSEAENRTALANTSSVAQNWSVLLFPNPNTGNFSIDLFRQAAAAMAFGITDQNGRLLLEQNIETGSQVIAINAETLPGGIYFLQVMEGGKVVAVEKFVKQ